MGYKYTVVWKMGSEEVYQKGTPNPFKAVWWLFTYKPTQKYGWVALEVR